MANKNMIFKDGFMIGGGVGFLGYLVTLGAINFEVANFSGVSNLSMFIIGFASLVFSPIVIWFPKTLSTVWKGFLVGVPWAVAVSTLLLPTIANFLASNIE